MALDLIETPFFDRRHNEPPFQGVLLPPGEAALMRQQGLMAERKKQALAQFDPGAAIKNLGFGSGVLNHSLVPFRNSPVFLRLVDTASELLDYAAGGFHVSVARGLVGGAGDDANSFGQALLRGRKVIVPQQPLKRADLIVLWGNAARAYKDVFDAGGKFSMELVDKLREANSLADRAYQAEGVAPPKDPGPATTEVPSSGTKDVATVGGSNRGFMIFGLLAAGITGFFAFRPTAHEGM